MWLTTSGPVFRLSTEMVESVSEAIHVVKEGFSSVAYTYQYVTGMITTEEPTSKTEIQLTSSVSRPFSDRILRHNSEGILPRRESLRFSPPEQSTASDVEFIPSLLDELESCECGAGEEETDLGVDDGGVDSSVVGVQELGQFPSRSPAGADFPRNLACAVEYAIPECFVDFSGAGEVEGGPGVAGGVSRLSAPEGGGSCDALHERREDRGGRERERGEVVRDERGRGGVELRRSGRE